MTHVPADSQIAIALQNISKCYKRYHRPQDRLLELLLHQQNRGEQFWALHPLDLEIEAGSSIGLVGQNGSGKSTLLQIIAGTLTPTTGTISVQGRVSALLELGSGFNPDFTGRQNVFLNGKILGMSQSEVEEKLDDILSFADIGDFIDQPVKVYSSGMFVRLAFAVAINVDPAILLIDEALAVGDIYFQQKCYSRLKRLAHEGTTFIFVSHDPGAILKLCGRAILLEHGHLIQDGPPKQIIDLYEAKLWKENDEHAKSLEIQSLESPDVSEEVAASLAQPASYFVQSQEVSIQHVKLLDERGQEVSSFPSGQSVELIIGLIFHKEFQDPHIGFKIRNRMGEVIFEAGTHSMEIPIGFVESETLVETSFHFALPLRDGDYTITVGAADSPDVGDRFEKILLYKHGVASFRILRDSSSTRWGGVVNLNPTLSYRKHHPSSLC